jgi:hypothetical protein
VTLTLYKADKEITAKIWMTFCDLRHAMDIPEDRKEAVLRWAMDLIRKLESARYHRARLLEILDGQFAARASEASLSKEPLAEASARRHSSASTGISRDVAAEGPVCP